MRSWLLSFFASGCVAGAAASDALSDVDHSAVLSAYAAYRAAWAANDRNAVLHALAPNVVLHPANSVPVVGRDGARRYWWPGDGASTTIMGFALAPIEVGGSGNLAYVRGISETLYSQEKDGVRTESTYLATSLPVLRRQPNGTWLITVHSWTPLPWKP